MKKLFIFIIIATCMSSCSVGGGFGVNNGGAGIGINSGIRW
ncbi:MULTISPECIES: hypothetical protein [Pasteurellaceae]|uniref:Lipoprotein n=1 Tax=Pasteurella bettyae CCUG 2042 TaxID=1095749 RepID=I3DFX9_9PAST|nr:MULTISPECIES: hypothetical protein [Pasteurellaceae]EIJ70622.1 hypothetical protein HMPREF1052_1765 [Pasteurella bettyae CCUG 2042]SUB21881.1 Uncharacterised protein [Pasteurella bettyae]